MDGFHGEGVTQDKGTTLCSTQVSQPVPGEDTLDRHHEALTIGRHGLEAGFRCGFQVAVHQDFPVTVHETDVHAPGRQVNTAVNLVWVGVEAHEVSSSFVSGSFPDASIPLGYAEGVASIIIKALEPTPSSVRCAPASSRG